MVNRANRAHPYAIGGKCRCGAKVVRGYDETSGRFAVVDIVPVNAGTETLVRAQGFRSYVLAWRGGMTVTMRSDDDVMLKPAGTTGARIVVDHVCGRSGGTQ